MVVSAAVPLRCRSRLGLPRGPPRLRLRWVRRRLRKVLREVREGADWVASLRGQGLINQADAAVLSSAQRVGNLPWALRETSSSAERRLSYRLQFWLQILFPVVVMAMGTMVFFYAVAYFMPLVRLIEALAT